MIDVYTYMTSKHFSGCRFIIGTSMVFHGLNYEDKISKTEKKQRIFYNEDENGNSGDKKQK